jgi:hypothetical protein
MKNIFFSGCNLIIGRDQHPYKELIGYRVPGQEKIIVTCYKLSFWERLQLLFKGKI